MTQDRNGKEITIGSIVTWTNGEKSSTGRISRLTKTSCNLRGVWGGRVFAKGLSIKEISESSAEFFSAWEKSDAYPCM